MSKLQRMKKQADIAKKETLSNTQAKLEETGMAFIDHELPPDEVDEKEVRKTLLASIRTFIPYTEEWYEARAAEEEMDDLRKIRVEKIKAADLYTLTKIGRHEEALDQMMAETNNDFFYFNKLKYKQEQEGKWKFEFKANSIAFGSADRGAHRNRLRKAANAVYGAMDAGVTDELARLSNAEAKGARRYDRSAPCNWRGKNKDGEPMKCENVRMEKPPRSDEPPPKKTDPPNILACCAYHTPFCVSDIHELREDVKIKVPNDEALCAECYMMKRGKKPPPLTPIIVPGAVPSAMAKLSAPPKEANTLEDANSVSQESAFSRAKRLKNANRCTWQPNADNARTRGYECCNNRFIHPGNNIKLATCPWHCQLCVRDHPDGSSPVITVPNPFALCAQHYLAEHGHPAVMPPFPFPGMQIKLARDHWKGKRHFAVPEDEPPPTLIAKEYVEKEEGDDMVNKFAVWVKMQLYNRRKRLYGKKMSTRIQAWFRGCQCRRIHVNIKYMREAYRRLVAAVKIQSLGRRYMASCAVTALRLKYKTSATHIERWWRGYKCRRILKIDWAARRITKFMKRLFFLKFRDSVIMIMQLRRIFKKRVMLAVKIQRVFRGHSARVFVFNKHYWMIVQRTYAKKIQQAFRQFVIRKSYVPWNPPGEDWALSQCAKKLSRMILEMYRDKDRRQDLARLMHASAPAVQRMIRGFLGRAGTKKMAFLRIAMRSWLQPRLAGEFMEKYLNSRMYFQKNLQITEVKEEARAHNPQHIRKFLPEEKRESFEVDFRSFDPAIEQWYKSKNMILLQSEKDALMRKFKNPMTGKVQAKPLDEFIESHKLPCRRHGRFVCGDCVFRKNCQIGGCKCVLFKSSTEDGHGICVHCDHPGSLHSLCPKQLRHANKTHKTRSQLLSILTAEREPDMSFPVGVDGVAAESVIIPAKTEDDLREQHTKTLRKEKTTLNLAHLMAERSLAKSLSLCETDGATVHSNLKYWETTPLSAVTPKEDHHSLNDTAIFDPVSYDPRAPDYHVSPAKFWTLTAKNPNKTTRDYHEKFEHNMPMPVVKDEQIVYTFEGPQIYFNLLNQIIRLDHKIHYDDPEFLKLVVDHVQIFERHWRKMVADIRTGKLDRKLQIAEESRMIFESANVPKPQLAKRLDDTFRKLGFHSKVLGKDIVIKEYAQKKKVGIYAVVKPRRKRSLPTNALSAILPPLSREKSPLGKGGSARVTTFAGLATAPLAATGSAIAGAGAGESPPPKPAAHLRFENAAPTKAELRSPEGKPAPLSHNASSPHLLRSRSELGSPTRSASQRTMLKGMGATSSTLLTAGEDSDSADASPKSKASKTKRELLSSLGQTFRALSAGMDAEESRPTTGVSASSRPVTGERTESPNRPGTKGSTTATPKRKRRGSDTAVRPVTAAEVDAVHYSIDTAARENYKHTIKTDGDRFVCPFPACGKSFHSMDAAFRHLPVHEQRTRLFAPTPLPDSHLAFYWPEGVPWLENERYAERAIPPGALACTVPGCTAVFSGHMQFEAHLRNVHKIVGHSSTTHGYFAMLGTASFVPPDRPPPSVPLHWCPLHSLPLGSCTVCVRIDASKGPKQPFRFFNGVKINFRLRRVLKLHAPNAFMNSLEADKQEVLLRCGEGDVGVIITGKGNAVAADLAKQHIDQSQGAKGALERAGSMKSLSRMRRTGSSMSVTSVGSHGSGGRGHGRGHGAQGAAQAAVQVPSEWRGRPVAFMTDRNENAWVAVEVLYTFQEAQQKGLVVPSDFNKRHQLLRPLRPFVSVDAHGNVNLAELEIYDTAAMEEFERYIRWVPLHKIERTFTLALCLTQEEVDEAISSAGHLALKNKFFVSHSDVEC